LNKDRLTNAQKRQEHINVNAIIGQMADVERSSRRLRRVIPEDKPVARIAASGNSIGLKQE
jgi:hypothetical protein